MNVKRAKRKKREALHHRQVWYEKSVDDLMKGKVPPGYVSKRWQKVKALKRRRRKNHVEK